nr:hypothetical protein Iba_chr14aCG21030 [Ipomoea batatas]
MIPEVSMLVTSDMSKTTTRTLSKLFFSMSLAAATHLRVLSTMKLALAKQIDPELILTIKMPGIAVAAGN